jgi:hypothetical protein
MFILNRTPNPEAADPVQAMCFVLSEARSLDEALEHAAMKVGAHMKHCGHCVAEYVDESELVNANGTLRYAWSNATEDWMLFETL